MTSTRDRVLAIDNNDELDSEAVMEEANEVMKERWLSIFIQLTNSRRFNQFLDANFTIGDRIDEENRTIETLVVENPQAVGPKLTGRQLAGIRIALTKVDDVDETFNKIMAILGQHEVSNLVTASGEDVSLIK